MTTHERAAELATELTRRLDAVGSDLPRDGMRLVVGTDDALRPLTCPAFGFAPDDGFRWSAVNARRILGLGALARLADPPPRPDEDLPDLLGATFDAMLRANRPEEGPLEAWLAELGPVAAATLRRAVVTWATAATTYLLPLGVDARIVLRGARNWQPRRGPFRVRARVDVEATNGDAVVISGRLDLPETARTTAAVAALVGCLHGSCPARVRVAAPAARRVDEFTVDERLLDDGVGAVVAAAATVVARAQDGDAHLPRVPGTHCWACPRRTTCAPGAAWLVDRRKLDGESG